MPNSFYNHTTPIARFTTADANRINASFKAIESGFDKIPSSTELSQGNRNYAIATNVGNDYSIILPFTVTSYNPGLQATFFTPSPNTGSSRLNVNGAGYITLRRFDGNNLLANDIRANSLNEVTLVVVDDVPSFRLTSMHGASETLASQSAASASTSASQAATSASQAASSATNANTSATLATNAANTATALVGASRGFRNAIVNPLFWMSQRLGSQTLGQTYTYPAGTYIRDRWKAGPGGISYAFHTSTPGITITSGSLQQVIQGRNLPFIGDYTISWTGSAVATVNGESVTNGGKVTISAAYQNLTITFSGGVVYLPQFEYGSIKTPFEWRPTDYERQACFQYYQKSYSDFTVPGTANLIGVYESIAVAAVSLSQSTIAFSVPMRATPSITIYNPNVANTTGSFMNGETSASHPAAVTAENDRSFIVFADEVQFTSGHRYRFHWTADAEL